MSEEDVVGRTVDVLFSLKREQVALILILILGGILRLIAAINTGDSADSMHFVTHAINFLSAGRLETYDQSSGLWFALTSIFYKILGATTFSSRLAALIFGTCSIPVMYLLAKEFFNDKISLTAAFLLAIAPFHIMNTSAEMDVMAMFFVLCGMLFFIKSLKSKKKVEYALAGVFLGLAVYTKLYPVFFVASLLLYSVYYSYKSEKRYLPNSKGLIIFLVIIGIFLIPAVTHNYLLYKEKGIMDLQFTRYFGLGENISEQYYGFDPIFHEKNDWKGFFLGNSKHGGEDTSPLFIVVMKFIFKPSPIIFLLGVLGLALFVRRKEERTYLYFFLLSILFILPFLGSIILLSKHFLFLEILLVPAAAYSLMLLVGKLSTLFKIKLVKPALVLMLLISLVLLGQSLPGTFPHFYGKSYISQVIEFKGNSIPDAALVVTDNRIYRGQSYWMFNDRLLLEATDFIQLVNEQDKLPGNTVPVEVDYVECVVEDCGWGTIKDSPQLNDSMEQFTSFMKNASELVKTISEPNKRVPYYPFGETHEVIRVYKAKFQIKEAILQRAAQPKNWFLYTVGYPIPSNEFDAYTPSGFFDSLLDGLAHLIVKLSVLLALLAPIYIIYCAIRSPSVQGGPEKI